LSDPELIIPDPDPANHFGSEGALVEFRNKKGKNRHQIECGSGFDIKESGYNPDPRYRYLNRYGTRVAEPCHLEAAPAPAPELPIFFTAPEPQPAPSYLLHACVS